MLAARTSEVGLPAGIQVMTGSGPGSCVAGGYSMVVMPTLLIVHHTPSPTTQAMLEAVLAGARNDAIEGVDVVVRPALAATAVDVLAADGYLLGTPANIGYMSGALKHFFDCVYHPILEAAVGRPYALYVHGGSDTTGAVRAVESIAATQLLPKGDLSVALRGAVVEPARRPHLLPRPVEQGVIDHDGQRPGLDEAVDGDAGERQADLVGRPDRPREEPVRPVVRPQRRQPRAHEHPAHRAPPGRREHPDDERPERPERRRGETRPETLQQHRERNRYRDVREHRRPLFRVG